MISSMYYSPLLAGHRNVYRSLAGGRFPATAGDGWYPLPPLLRLSPLYLPRHHPPLPRLHYRHMYVELYPPMSHL